MIQSEMIALKERDQVVYNGNSDHYTAFYPNAGTVLTRTKSWLDDDFTVRFEFIDQNGDTDHHFFSAEDIDFIKE